MKRSTRSPAYPIALQIVEKLFAEGFIAYFAGGWVRDRLLGKQSEEIDIATSAPPHVIQNLFPKTVSVGVAFGVVVVILKGHNFEVTTFRKDHEYVDGRHPEGVDFSTPEKDAMRRDFTINGLFYDPLTDTIHDYVGGQEDIKKKIIRAIGNPEHRFSEDRLRMIRAVRFSSRLGFPIENATELAIRAHAHTLFPSVSIERIWQEFTKMAAYPKFDEALKTMHHLGLLTAILPQLQHLSEKEMSKRCSPLPYFPLHCPTIIYLMELFPKFSLSERLEICHYLKTTRNDIKLVEFFVHAEILMHSTDKSAWAHFYADPRSALFLEVYAARLTPSERTAFLEEKQLSKERMEMHIERILKHTPLVNAHMLQKEGVKPGKVFGMLLKEAERFAIEEDLHDPAPVLSYIKQSPFWP